jgi:hypothetical protein
MGPSTEASARAPPSLQWVPWPPLAGALRFPTFIGTMRRYDCSTTHSHPPPVSLGGRYLPDGEEMGSSLGFLGNPWEACPELGTPATLARPRIAVVPDTAFRKANGVGIATGKDFGAESSRPASLLCTLRTHQSPGEWQHSLLACLLDVGQTGLAPAGFHQEVSPIHRFLLFQAFPNAIA